MSSVNNKGETRASVLDTGIVGLMSLKLAPLGVWGGGRGACLNIFSFNAHIETRGKILIEGALLKLLGIPFVKVNARV